MFNERKEGRLKKNKEEEKESGSKRVLYEMKERDSHFPQKRISMRKSRSETPTGSGHESSAQFLTGPSLNLDIT